MKWAESLDENFIKTYLWTSGPYLGGVIKFDLDWIAEYFIGNSTCDLWQEVRNNEFLWNYVVSRNALLKGVKFATKIGDTDKAAQYQKVVDRIDLTISDFWENSQFITEATNRQKDAAVFLALNIQDPDDPIMLPTNPHIAATIKALNNDFCAKFQLNNYSMYDIPGIFYGRYPSDVYQGGNPWILVTAGLAETFYKAASYVGQNGISQNDSVEWIKLLGMTNSSLSNETLQVAMKNAGDSVLSKIYYFVKNYDFQLPEQLNKTTGEPVSAKNLTLSYASVIQALRIRSQITSFTKQIGIDVSENQGDIDWSQVATQNYSFVIVQATNGMTVDIKFNYNWQQIKLVTQLKPGAYHIFQPAEDPEQQASLFCSTVIAYPTVSIAPILDVEISGNLTKEKLQENILIWLNYVNSTLGIKPMIYTTFEFATKYLNESFGNFDLYLSSLNVKEPIIPNIWKNVGKTWTILQYSTTDEVQGINGNVYLDYMN